MTDYIIHKGMGLPPMPHVEPDGDKFWACWSNGTRLAAKDTLEEALALTRSMHRLEEN